MKAPVQAASRFQLVSNSFEFILLRSALRPTLDMNGHLAASAHYEELRRHSVGLYHILWLSIDAKGGSIVDEDDRPYILEFPNRHILCLLGQQYLESQLSRLEDLRVKNLDQSIHRGVADRLQHPIAVFDPKIS